MYDTVTWCATTAADAPTLSAELDAFTPSLPAGVTVGVDARDGR
jgi:hypothetical protein